MSGGGSAALRVEGKANGAKHLMKTWSRALRTLHWAGSLPSNKTVILNIQPRRHPSSLGTTL